MKVRVLKKLFFNNVTYFSAKERKVADVFNIPEKFQDGKDVPRWTPEDKAVIELHMRHMFLPRTDGLDKKDATIIGLPKAFSPMCMEKAEAAAVTPKGTGKRPVVGGGGEVAEKH